MATTKKTATTASASASAAAVACTTVSAPKILKDPRFRAGAKLIQSGRDGAIDVFANLLEEARSKYGEASVETSPAYFEYGNALFRESQRRLEQQQQQQQEAAEQDGDGEEEGKRDEPTATTGEAKAVNDDGENSENDKESAVVRTEDQQDPSGTGTDDTNEGNGEQQPQAEDEKKETETEEEQENGEEQNEEQEEEEDDTHLALDMMETSFSILDNYVQSASQVSDANDSYVFWAKRVQLPRVLLNIGDVLSALGRHADAADVYTRELAYREANVESYDGKDVCLEELRDRRKAVEANLLVAVELLACPKGQDVVTTETNSLLVTGSELVAFATGYYDAARLALQDTVYFMGNLAAKGKVSKDEFDEEKENVCFASSMLIGVGEQLASYDEKKRHKEAEESIEPSKKKAKR